jgi:hypothetical protein
MLMKTKVNIMYFAIFAFMGYFMIDALHTVNDMTISEMDIPDDTLGLDIPDTVLLYPQIVTYDYNDTYSSYIKTITYDILQIIMLILVFMRIYVVQTIKEYAK